MKHTVILFILSLIILSACNNGRPVKETYRDSAMAEYFKYADSIGIIDTITVSYKVLKAYINNDTIFLKEVIQHQAMDTKAAKYWQPVDSCIHQPDLRTMHVDEAYRFIYEAPFCPYKINTTITKKDSNINLHFIIYVAGWDTAKCTIINQYDKKLTIKNWEEFNAAMDKADFWGLKKGNGLHGLDGNNIDVMGYSHTHVGEKKMPKYNSVSRWGSTNGNLEEALDLLLIFSENDKGCHVIKRRLKY